MFKKLWSFLGFFLVGLFVALPVILPAVPAAALNSNGAAPSGTDSAQLQHGLLLLLALLMVVCALRLPSSTPQNRLLSVFVHLWLAASLVLVVAIDEGALEILAPGGPLATNSGGSNSVNTGLVTSSTHTSVPLYLTRSSVNASSDASSDPMAVPKYSGVLQGASCGTIAPMDVEVPVSRPYVGFSQ